MAFKCCISSEFVGEICGVVFNNTEVFNLIRFTMDQLDKNDLLPKEESKKTAIVESIWNLIDCQDALDSIRQFKDGIYSIINYKKDEIISIFSKNEEELYKDFFNFLMGESGKFDW